MDVGLLCLLCVV